MKRLKKAAALLLTCALLCLSSACQVTEPLGDWLNSMAKSFDSPSSASSVSSIASASSSEGGEFRQVSRETASALSDYEKIDQRGDYDTLSEEGKRLYTDLLESFYQISAIKNENGLYVTKTVATQDFSLGDNELKSVIMAVQNDNPQVFWLSNTYTTPVSLKGGVKLQFYALLSARECNEKIAAMNRSVEQIFAGIPDGLSELDREEYIVQAVEARCEYDQSALEVSQEKNKRWQPYSAYGMLCEGKAVCEGYARATQLLCAYAGIPCRLVIGWGDSERHMWNLVRIDGEWYHLDVTWNDDDSQRYDYFNLTDAQIQKTHKISPPIDEMDAGDEYDFNLPLPACTADTANYFKAKGIEISGFSKSQATEMAASLKPVFENKRTSVAFYIDKELDYQTAVNKLFTQAPYLFMDCVVKINSQLNGLKIDEDNLSYTTAPDCRGVTVLLEYIQED